MGQLALVLWQERWIEALSGARDLQGHGQSADAQFTLWGVTVSAIVGMIIEVELSFGVDGGAEQFAQAAAQEVLEILRADESVEGFVASELLSQLVNAVLNTSQLVLSVHLS